MVVWGSIVRTLGLCFFRFLETVAANHFPISKPDVLFLPPIHFAIFAFVGCRIGQLLQLRTGSALVGSLSAIAYATVFASLSHGTTGAKAAFIMALQQLCFWKKNGEKTLYFFHRLIFHGGGWHRCIISYESPFIVVDLHWSCCGSWPGKFLDQNVPKLKPQVTNVSIRNCKWSSMRPQNGQSFQYPPKV